MLQDHRVEVKLIQPTEKGKKELDFQDDKPLYVYPEADMLLSLKQHKTYSGFSDWGKGWVDPEIRRRRLERRERKPRRERKKKPRKERSRGSSSKLHPWRSKE